MDFQRIVWSWDALVERLRGEDEALSLALRRSCRPMEAERRADGWLTLVLGSWWRPDLVALGREPRRGLLERALGRMLEEQLRTVLVPWPGGFAAGPAEAEEIPAPDLLAGLPQEAREAAAACESPIQRYFYAQAYRRGLRPRCQHQLLNYRVDFAFPAQRVAAEVVGWEWHRAGRGAGVPREREEQLGVESWRVRWFAGAEVLADVQRCLDQLDTLLAGSQGLMTRGFANLRREARPTPGRWPHPTRRPPRR